MMGMYTGAGVLAAGGVGVVRIRTVRLGSGVAVPPGGGVTAPGGHGVFVGLGVPTAGVGTAVPPPGTVTLHDNV